jgi:hypothetical protein
VTEAKDWRTDGATINNVHFSQCVQLSPEQPTVFLRRRFVNSASNGGGTNTAGPAPGVLLWIERTNGPTAHP